MSSSGCRCRCAASDTAQTAEARAFAERLARRLGERVPVALHDERLTTRARPARPVPDGERGLARRGAPARGLACATRRANARSAAEAPCAGVTGDEHDEPEPGWRGAERRKPAAACPARRSPAPARRGDATVCRRALALLALVVVLFAAWFSGRAVPAVRRRRHGHRRRSRSRPASARAQIGDLLASPRRRLLGLLLRPARDRSTATARSCAPASFDAAPRHELLRGAHGADARRAGRRDDQGDDPRGLHAPSDRRAGHGRRPDRQLPRRVAAARAAFDPAQLRRQRVGAHARGVPVPRDLLRRPGERMSRSSSASS